MKTGEDRTITRDPTLAARTVYSEEYPRVKPRNLYYSVQKDCKNKTDIKPLFCNISIKAVLFDKARHLLITMQFLLSLKAAPITINTR